MNAPMPFALPSHFRAYTREHARRFVEVLTERMQLTKTERAALIHAGVHWHTMRDRHGVIINGKWTGPVADWTGPREIEWSPAALIHAMNDTACWISALRGKKARRGSAVMAVCCGRSVFGRVIRVNKDGTLRIRLDDGEASFARYTTGIYNGRTIIAMEPDFCAVLAD